MSKPLIYFLISLMAVYLLTVLTIAIGIFGYILLGNLPLNWEPVRMLITCSAVGGIGGCLYTLRGIYISQCIKKNWDHAWLPWYFIRPLASIICGGFSFLLLKAGLIVLESVPKEEATEMGFYVFAFIAGLNVDKFIVKVEDVAKNIWGIENSRSARRDSTT